MLCIMKERAYEVEDLVVNNKVHVSNDSGNNDNKTDFENFGSHNSDGNKDNKETTSNQDENYSVVQSEQLQPSIDDIYHTGHHYGPVKLNPSSRVRVARMSTGSSNCTLYGANNPRVARMSTGSSLSRRILATAATEMNMSRSQVEPQAKCRWHENQDKGKTISISTTTRRGVRNVDSR